MPNNPLDDYIDSQIIQRMTADEQHRTEVLAARIRQRLESWSERITVMSGDRPLEYRITYRGPLGHMWLNMALPPDSDIVAYIVNYVAETVIGDFEAKLWEKFKDVFEGHERINRRLFHDMLWKAIEQDTNSGKARRGE
ncbi:hypothetical protein UFOVP142_53 [uncultured Caudovirales phage]|uniref:Uncharacterized protein n=1 Tax=uncultured Caudovirales phage TaxID=2100421 RepID=A0A6J7XL32_9CAUD|nr:hypothetical protein UFOVP142_53 [uncultured Caudovirales phage]